MPQDSFKPEIPPFLSRYLIANPEEFASNLLRAYERGSLALAQLAERPDAKAGPYTPASEFSAATETLTSLARTWLSDPVKLSEAQTLLFGQFANLWNNVLARAMGMPIAPLIEPASSDNRFKDPEWSANPFFDFCKQAYLLACKWAEDQLAATPGLDERARHRAEFYLRQLTSAYSPTNFLATNPEVLRETIETNGRNLLEGANLLAEDLRSSGDLMKISQTDANAFELGRNLATTPGKVVFQNELLQLIQYVPATDKVRERPILMVPPWINKYYILDLTSQKSFIKYVVDQGFTVFVVSWVNPDEKLAEKTFEDYILEGILEAVRAVKQESGVEKINVLGYCVGGTALATGLAYLAQRGEEPFKSCTLLTTQVDFTLAGDLLLFTDDNQLDSLDALMTEKGFLDGSRMANVFNMMRPRDLIWPYVINNYMLGKKPFPFDLLFWNQDSTRMAAANHKFYLREFYNENRLAKGEMDVGGIKLDLGKIKLPIFSVATREDHIAPAASVFRGMQMLGGPVEFVLAGSGHIAGVINPPSKAKYQFWTKGTNMANLADWQASASVTPGSWWPYWIEWLSQQSGGWIEARAPGKKLGVIEDAPGSYVKAS
ncbi:Poly-beta-hydroxybutyrate polymerase [Hyphomicrobium sp. GJ21]|jgi:polyhydroxyalkanoate synthase|uniref:PHA/PHB synthase family protein n=1 Tax=Hyphomicrobium sp. GJ21 TaxID=113574 RepID=UPI000622B53B|nr:class I poly(R)-hydroxyalkanoic acid synthase [Hyphomicrobium sp. GJ21]CEJ85173.1 Poly-beta-hydroxybutyrate polymerase [Hyphomicrobium sp. GJ21]